MPIRFAEVQARAVFSDSSREIDGMEYCAPSPLGHGPNAHAVRVSIGNLGL